MDHEPRDIAGIVKSLDALRNVFAIAETQAGDLSVTTTLNAMQRACGRAGGLLEAAVERCVALRAQLPESLRERPVMQAATASGEGEVYVPDLYWKSFIGWLMRQADTPIVGVKPLSGEMDEYQYRGDYHSVRVDRKASTTVWPELCRASVAGIDYLREFVTVDGDGGAPVLNEERCLRGGDAKSSTDQPGDELSPAETKAYESYRVAESTMPQSPPTDQEAYDWLKDNTDNDDALRQYDLPAFETWQRYVRNGRKVHGTQKNTPKNGRAGRSVVKQSQL